MPIYEYTCPQCCKMFEEWVKNHDTGPQMCPECGTLSPHIVSNTSFVLKGGGWYVTEYGNRQGADASASGDAAASTDSAGTDSSATAGVGAASSASSSDSTPGASSATSAAPPASAPVKEAKPAASAASAG